MSKLLIIYYSIDEVIKLFIYFSVDVKTIFYLLFYNSWQGIINTFALFIPLILTYLLDSQNKLELVLKTIFMFLSSIYLISLGFYSIYFIDYTNEFDINLLINSLFKYIVVYLRGIWELVFIMIGFIYLIFAILNIRKIYKK